VLSPLLPADAVLHPCAPIPTAPRPVELRGFAALRHLWESVLAPLAVATAPGVRDAVAAAAPDVLVADQQALAGALVAERLGLPWATSATTSGEFTDPLAALPQVRRWRDDLLAALRRRIGDPGCAHDPRFSPHLVLGYTSTALVDPPSDLPVRLVGPVPRPEPADPDFPWHQLDPAAPLVLITLGTANDTAGTRFLTQCATTLDRRPHLRAVLVDPAGAVPNPPPNVLVRARIPQQAVLDRASAVICHAGHNTVCETLARGLPLVVAPIRDDQPVVADQVVRAGAGRRLRFTHATADHIGTALDAVLTQPAYRDAAQRVADSFRAAGGAQAAADALESLANSERSHKTDTGFAHGTTNTTRQ
jgi:UDP:flavonoid glycosyltransferase YjiC (YdhE family)